MACSADQSPRRRRLDVYDEIEEGEIVHGYDTDSDTEDDDHSRYVFQPRDDGDGRAEVKRRRLEDMVAVGGKDSLLPSPTSSFGSDEIISDDKRGFIGDKAISAGAQGQHAAPSARDHDGRWYCKEKDCDKWFNSHQGLGGHMAGHKLRQNAAAASGVHQGGVVACSGGSAKPAKTHVCKTCGKVLPSGVALGGHKRKHYDGKVIPKKRGACSAPAAVEGPEFPPLALSTVQASLTSAAPAMEIAVEPAEIASVPEPAAPAHVPVVEATRPVPAGSIRLFGVTIVQAAPAATEEGSSAVTDAESSAASTNIR